MIPIRDHNPSLRTPYVTYVLLALNIAVYLYGLAFLTTDMATNRFYFDYAMIPARLSGGENYAALITSQFLHAGFMHLAGNMLFLWIYGDNLEDKMGHLPFLAFYLACGIAAAMSQYIMDPQSVVPMVGASGAIAGVMGGYLLLFPKARIDIFIFFVVIIRIIPIPAWIVLGLWFAIQIFSSITVDASGGGVAYWAHAGGFIVGLILTIPLWFRLGAGGWWVRTDYHPPNPEARYPRLESRIPKVTRK